MREQVGLNRPDPRKRSVVSTQSLISQGFAWYDGPSHQVVPALRQQPGTRPEPSGGSDVLDATYVLALAKIWERVDRNGDPSVCWEWPGSRNPQGYATVGVTVPGNPRAWVSVHRASLAEKLGRMLTADEVTMHSCDNPPCVNPAHLSVGSRSDNTEDMISKGRGGPLGMQMAARRLQTHCKWGHEFTPENTYHWRYQRQCRACNRRRGRERHHRKKGTT